MKLLRYLVEGLCWVQLFLCPAAILGFAGYVVYHNFPGNWGIAGGGVLLLTGVGLGIYFAERVRGSGGCSTLMFRIFALKR